MTRQLDDAALESVTMARAQWAFDVLSNEIARGRELGYVKGESDVVRSVRVPSFDQDAQDPFTVALERAGVESGAQDALWLLTCIEREPALARLVEAITNGATDLIPVSLLERVTGSSVDAMRDQGLVVLGTGESRHRRGVQLSAPVRALFHGSAAPKTLEATRLEALALIPGAADEVRAGFRANAVITIVATPGLGRRSLAVAIAAEHGLSVCELDARRLRTGDDELRAVVREFILACRLHDAVPLLSHIDALGQRCDVIADTFSQIAGPAGPVLMTSNQNRPNTSWQRPAIVVELRRPTSAQLAQVWSAALALGASTKTLEASRMADEYPLAPGLIHRACASARARAGGRPVTLEDVRAGVRAELASTLGESARRIEVTQTWDDIELPINQLEQVQELVVRVRKRADVLERWGFASKLGRGTGIAALFTGPPGTGKTMIAGLIANELGVDLYQVDLGKVVSKYIGETEKQLGAMFDAAEAGHVILLFDEADSLFAKRSDVKSSNDRYANMETNYLLQRMESFTGICLLTSNHERSLDPAFRRRLSLHLRFEPPAEEERARLWRATLPPSVPLEDGIDFAMFGRRYEMSGGHIRNVTLRAAYFAADEGTCVKASHLERAARIEMEAMGRLTFGN